MKPDYVSELESVFGPPSSSAWGSAVFFDQVSPTSPLEFTALTTYRLFVGELWKRFGEDAWMSGWRPVFTRAGTGNIVDELERLDDWALGHAVEVLLHGGDNVDRRASTMRTAFDAPDTQEVRVFTTGDGGQMSGLLIIGRRTNGDATSLVFLLD